MLQKSREMQTANLWFMNTHSLLESKGTQLTKGVIFISLLIKIVRRKHEGWLPFCSVLDRLTLQYEYEIIPNFLPF